MLTVFGRAFRTPDLRNKLLFTLAIVAISPAVARAAGDGWGGMDIATMPEDAAMVAAAIDRASADADKRSQ